MKKAKKIQKEHDALIRHELMMFGAPVSHPVVKEPKEVTKDVDKGAKP